MSEVVSVEETPGEIRVELARSHARHVLSTRNNDFPELLERLRVAVNQQTLQIVTETDQHEIIDVRPHTGDLPFNREARATAIAPQTCGGRGGRGGSGYRLCWFCWFCRCVTPARAQALFDLCSAQTCNP